MKRLGVAVLLAFFVPALWAQDDGCKSPPNPGQVGLVVLDGETRDGGAQETGSCACDVGKKAFFGSAPSENSQDPSRSTHIAAVRFPQQMDQCDLCIIDEAGNECKITNPNGRVINPVLIPYCVQEKCHVYVSLAIDNRAPPPKDATNLPALTCGTKSFTEFNQWDNGNMIPLNPDTSPQAYVHAAAFTCKGCAAIKDSNCLKPTTTTSTTITTSTPSTTPTTTTATTTPKPTTPMVPATPTTPANPTCVDAVPDCADKKSLCTVAAYQKLMAYGCAGTCGYCTSPPTPPPPTARPPTLPPLPTCVDGVPDCADKKVLCTNQQFQKLMAYGCADTCGYCTSTATPVPPTLPPLPTCVDKAPDCKQKAYLCTNPTYQKLMSEVCAITCGYCTPPPTPPPPTLPPLPSCVDTVGDCKQKSQLCRNPVYLELMTRVCAFTCGFCTSTPVPPTPCTAVDKGYDCPQKAFLCKNTNYVKLMSQVCARTCGYCTPPLPPPVPTCVDNAPDCRQKARLCNNRRYRQLMSQVCAYTCRRC